MNKLSVIDIIKNARPRDKFILPSEWNSKYRVIKSAYSKHFGKWNWKWSPYFRELLDNLDPSSSVQWTSLIKCVQIGYTQNVIEPGIGYTIDVFPRSMIYATATAKLAQKNISTRIQALLEGANLLNKIRSSSQKKNNRQSGDTLEKKEFDGGELHALGGQDPNQSKQISCPIEFLDEVDGWPEVTVLGCPVELMFARSDAFDNDRKIFIGSTPGKAHKSHIERIVNTGDMRYYMVPCPRCGCFDALFFRGGLVNGKYINDGIHNLKYEVDDDGILKPDSVYYQCRSCNGKILEHEKMEMMNAGYWKPTKKPQDPTHRSYTINSMYNLMKTWNTVILNWLKVKNDPKKLETFINNECAETFEEVVNKVNPQNVFDEKRRDYETLIIPNSCSVADGNGPIIAVTCAVDVNKKNTWLAVEMMGHCSNGQTYDIAKGAIHGSIEKDGSAWDALKYIIESNYYSDDSDPLQYNISITVIDCNYKTDEVLYFCNNNLFCVPIRGRESLKEKKNQKVTIHNNKAFNIDTRYYKIQIFNNLHIKWDGRPQKQPNNYPNFPDNIYQGGFEKLNLAEKFGITFSQNGYDLEHFKCFESEVPIIIELPNGKKTIKGFKPRIKNKTHFFDTSVYNLAALDIYIRIVCETEKIPIMDTFSMLSEFRKFLENNKMPYLIDRFDY